MTGRVLSNEWLGHVERRVVAAGGSEADAHCIYDAFYEAKVEYKENKFKRIAKAGGGVVVYDGEGQKESVDIARKSAARLRAAARKKFAKQLQQCEDTVFCLEKPVSAGTGNSGEK